MSKEKNIREIENKREEFLFLSKKVYPLIEQIRSALKESSFGDSAFIVIGSGDYMEFKPYDSEWRLNRYSNDGSPVAQFEHKEKIYLEEEE